MIKTRKLKLVSSKLKKFVFPYDSSDETKWPDWKVGDEIKGNWEYVEDETQSERLNNTYQVSYVSDGVVNRLHSLEDAAISSKSKDVKEKGYYINGIKYSKDDWKSLIDDSKMDPLPATDKVFGRN